MIIDGCPIAREPFSHQLETWRRTRDIIAYGIIWEQGTGKSKLAIDEMAWLFQHGKINGGLVFAPNGVHRNWVLAEMPGHWPHELGKPTMAWYRSQAASTKRHQAEIQAAIDAPGMSLLAMSYDALLTDRGKNFAKQYLTKRKVFAIADEGSRIKNHKSKRTILCQKAGALAAYRRLLNGTPIPNSPFDIYSQIKFIDANFWPSKGITSFEGFKTTFGTWDKSWASKPGGGMYQYPVLVNYRQLDLLQTYLKEITSRVLKEDVLDLPPKVYKRMGFELEPAQRRIYTGLKEECMAMLSSGEMVTAVLALTKLLRLQQVTCGYLPTDEDPNLRMICESNPRLDLLGEIVEDIPHSGIIWVRFQMDAQLICDRLKTMGKTFARYDGSIKKEQDRRESVEGFQQGKFQWFVANPAAGGEGLTLLGDQSVSELSCKTVIYYSNSFNLRERLQSEDRAHRIGQNWSVEYIDLFAENTVDQKIVTDLVEKNKTAGQVTGDKLRQWLSNGDDAADDYSVTTDDAYPDVVDYAIPT